MGCWRGDNEDNDSIFDENQEIEDNGTTIITLTVPISTAKDVCDLVVDMLDEKGLEHTIKMK